MSVDLSKLEALAARIPRPVRNSAPAPWYRVGNTSGDRAELFIYGAIDDWDGTSAAGFTSELRNIIAPSIDLHINSPGGMVFEATAIYTALKRHPATVDVHIDGIAASAASFVAMAGDTIAIEKPAKMMIHRARGVVMGESDDMRAMAELLDELSGTIADIYADRTGKPAAQWLAAMQATTWYSAEQAVTASLADRISGATASPEAVASFDAPTAQTVPTDSLRSQQVRARARVALKGAK